MTTPLPAHRYTCAICHFTTDDPATLAGHQVEKHGHALPAPALRDGRLATPSELLADHLARLLAGRDEDAAK